MENVRILHGKCAYITWKIRVYYMENVRILHGKCAYTVRKTCVLRGKYVYITWKMCLYYMENVRICTAQKRRFPNFLESPFVLLRIFHISIQSPGGGGRGEEGFLKKNLQIIIDRETHRVGGVCRDIRP